jgi:hypothetical protein
MRSSATAKPSGFNDEERLYVQSRLSFYFIHHLTLFSVGDAATIAFHTNPE